MGIEGILGGILAAIVAGFAFFFGGSLKGRAQERDRIEGQQAQDTLKRTKEGRDAASNARRDGGDLADRMRENDGQW